MRIIKAKSLPNLLTNEECWKKNVVIGVRERFCWIHFHCALGAKVASFRFEDDDKNEDQVQLLLIVRMLKSVTMMA